MTRLIEKLTDISDRYEAVFCDLWGCLHNGIQPFAAAVEALEVFRDRGGIVLLLTNSPRPKMSVQEQLDGIGVDRGLYREIASSGDSARAALAAGLYGKKVYHLGPERDLPFFVPGGDPETEGLAEIERVSFDDAENIVCTGLFDDNSEGPEDYRATFLAAKARGLKMLCANPDIMVDRGDRRIYCAGALAQAYEEMGAEVHLFGKPHPPIYNLARRRLNNCAGRAIPDTKILCIGDGINTDIKGAIGEDLDSLFITGGLAAKDTATVAQPDPAKLQNFIEAHKLSPTFAIGRLGILFAISNMMKTPVPSITAGFTR